MIYKFVKFFPFYYYSSSLRSFFFVFYLYFVFFRNKKIIIYYLMLFIFLFAKVFIDPLLGQDLIVSLLLFRLYFGFLFFYFLISKKINIKNFLIIIPIFTIAEYLISNFLGCDTVTLLPNYIQKEVYENYCLSISPFNGVLGPAGNRTINGILCLCIYWQYRDHSFKYTIISFLGLIFSGSLTAYLFFFLLYSIKNLRFLILLSLLLLCYIFIDFDESLYRYSFEYIKFVLLDYKYEQVEDYILFIKDNDLRMFFGDYIFLYFDDSSPIGLRYGDFAMLNFLSFYGVIGTLILLSIILFNINKFNALPLIVLVLSSFHYGVIHNFLGQLILGYFLFSHEINSPAKIVRI